jgi:hypothetical protein
LGPLYHKGGVILGDALIEAYELESRVANYPRIVVSRKLYSRIESGFGNLFLFKDHDGITHFDYIRQMILRYGEQGEKLTVWLEGVRRTATENIDRFEREERWNEFSKWIWFRNMLDRSRGSLPDGLFQ